MTDRDGQVCILRQPGSSSSDFDEKNYRKLIGLINESIVRSGHKPHYAGNVERIATIVAQDHEISFEVVIADLTMPDELAVRVRALHRAARAPD